MKKIIGIIIAIVVIGWLVLGIMRSRETEEVKSITDIQKEEGFPVLAEAVQPREVRVVRSFYGTLQATDQAVVSAKLMERVEDIRVEEGDRVRAGQALVVFDTSASQAAINQARLQYKNARRDLQRMNSLLESGAVSQQQVDQMELAAEIAEENYQTARRSVVLEAPIAGTVARVNVNEGDLASPGDPMVTIVSDRGYDVVFDVTQQDRPRLATGQTVIVTLDNGEQRRGTIRRISQAAGAMTRLFQVYASLENAQGLYAGTLTSVNVVVERADNVLAVPAEAILTRDNQPVVFVVRNDTLALRRPVQLGIQGEEFIEVTSGLQRGDVIATYGHAALDDSAKVKVVADAGGVGA